VFFVRVDDPECAAATCELCGAEWVPGPRGPGFVTVLRWHAIEHLVEPSVSEPDVHGQCQRQLGHPGSCMVWANGNEWVMRQAPMRPEQKRNRKGRRGTG